MVKSSVLHLETLLDQQAEPFKRLLEESLQELLEGQMTEFVGAAAGERTAARSGYRAGHITRSLATRIGPLELRVPRDRARRFCTDLLDRYPRSETALISALGQMVMRGSTTAKAKAAAEALCGHAFSTGSLGQIKKGLDDALTRYARSALAEPCRRLILRARSERVRIDGVIRSRVVLTAIGIDREGVRRVLGVELANRVSRAGWNCLLRRLKQCGLRGVKFVAADGGCGVDQAVRKSRVQRRSRRPTQAYAAPVPDVGGQDSADAADPHVVSHPALPPTDWTRRTTSPPDGRSCGALHEDRSRPSRLLAGLAAALVAAGFLFWGMRLMGDGPAEPAMAPAAFDGAPRHVEAVQLLGQAAPVGPRPVAAPPVRSRFQLSGVVAAKTAGGGGIALIGIDGGSARVFRVGATVDGDLVLQAVGSDGATLGPAGEPATVILEVATAAPSSRAVVQAGAGQTSSVVAGALPPMPNEADAAQPAPAIAGNVPPMTAEVGAVLPTTAADLVPSAVPAGQVASGALSPGERRRLRRLNATR